MSERVELTLLTRQVQGIARGMRLLRLQVDSLIGAVPPRLAVIEQSFHELVLEVARGFGRVRQQTTRHETRLDAVSAGLAALRGEIAGSTACIMAALQGR